MPRFARGRDLPQARRLVPRAWISCAHPRRICGGTHAECNGHPVSGTVTIAQIHTVAQSTTSTDNGSHVTFDGYHIGTITAYCVGVSRCPDAVNANG